jgi:hypothetical protein
MLELNKTLKVEFALFCEDVREEVGNKFSAVGIFTGEIVTDTFPAKIRAAFLISIKAQSSGIFPLWIRLLLDGEKLMEGMSEMAIKEETGVANLIVPSGTIGIERPGTLTLELSLDSKKWVQVLEKCVMRRS